MRKRFLVKFIFLTWLFFTGSMLPAQDRRPLSTARDMDDLGMLQQITEAFDTLKFRSVRPAEGYIKYDYLIPAGFYKQMWDWDGFFIGCYLASHDKADAKYLKWWVLNFAGSADTNGYVSGCINTKGPRPIFGKFAMKPFLSQGAYFASYYGGDFKWLLPVYPKLKKVLEYREKTQFDPSYGLFFWDIAIQSGADNNPALTNDTTDRSAILAADINTFQLREYIAMEKIAQKFGYKEDEALYEKKAADLQKAMLKYLWFPEDRSFFNIRRDNRMPLKKVTYSNFIPLIQAMLPQEEGRAMIRRYLLDPEQMMAPYGFRSLSKKEPEYNNACIIVPYSNWQGPIWINANFLYSIALKNYGFEEEASWIGKKLAPLLLNDIATCGSMHECYDAETGAPLAPTAEQSPNHIFTGFVGWNMLEQNLLEGAVVNKWMLLELK